MELSGAHGSQSAEFLTGSYFQTKCELWGGICFNFSCARHNLQKPFSLQGSLPFPPTSRVAVEDNEQREDTEPCCGASKRPRGVAGKKIPLRRHVPVRIHFFISGVTMFTRNRTAAFSLLS